MPPMREQLVAKVKEIQRSGNDAKQAWWDYCDSELGGVRDPNRHDPQLLHHFLQSMGVDVDMQIGPPVGGGGYGRDPPGAAGKGGGAFAGRRDDTAHLVERVKQLQRSSEDAKQAWWDYCDSELGGVRDPNRHDAPVLESFLQSMGVDLDSPLGEPVVGGFAGNTFGSAGESGGSPLSEFIRMGQKVSKRWKEAWKLYCSMYGTGFNDPARYDEAYIVGFIDYIGDMAQADLGIANMPVMGKGMGQSTMGGYGTYGGGGAGGGGMKRPSALGDYDAPPAKRPAMKPLTGDEDKGALVDRIKALQRQSGDLKSKWWAFTDEHHGGIHDPSRLDRDVLAAFLSGC